jgi:hypothetical protein
MIRQWPSELAHCLSTLRWPRILAFAVLAPYGIVCIISFFPTSEHKIGVVIAVSPLDADARYFDISGRFGVTSVSALVGPEDQPHGENSAGLYWSSLLHDGNTSVFPIEVGMGWPFRCMYWCKTRGNIEYGIVVRDGCRTVIEPAGGFSTYSTIPAAVLPWRPIWAGLSLNVLVYGICYVVMSTLIVFFMQSYNQSRHDGYGCRYCGYDIRNLPGPCPECGGAVKKIG